MLSKRVIGKERVCCIVTRSSTEGAGLYCRSLLEYCSISRNQYCAYTIAAFFIELGGMRNGKGKDHSTYCIVLCCVMAWILK